MRHARSLWPLLALAVACTTVPVRGGFDEVSKRAKDRTGHELRWIQSGAEDREVAEALKARLAEPLTPDVAVEIALLRNHGLQALYEELGVAQADVVQAGLLRNPTLGLSLGFPHVGGFPVTSGVSLAQEFLDVFTIPLRTRVAESAFTAAKWRVTDGVLDLAARTRAAFVRVQATQQIAGVRQLVFDAGDATAELARRQRGAGNISAYTLTAQETAAEVLRLDLVRARTDTTLAREELTRLLGLWGDDVHWRIEATLPDVAPVEVPVAALEELAIARRADVAGARAEEEAFRAAVALARGTRYVGRVDVGLHTAREVEDVRITGPSLDLELPVFDQRQAEIARLEARQRQAEQRLLERSVVARSEVRSAAARVEVARDLADRYRTKVLPLREQLVALAQEQYDAMLLGVYQLLAVRQAEANAYAEYIETVRDAWVARAELERAVGGPLPSGAK